MKRHLPLLFAAVLAACSYSSAPTPDTPASPSTTQTGSRVDTLSVRLGQSAFADGGRLEIRFDARVGDSRCPANATCVWQGDAHVRIITRVAGGTARNVDLHTALDPSKITVDRYVISLVGMTPYPGTGQDDATPILIVRVAGE